MKVRAVITHLPTEREWYGAIKAIDECEWEDFVNEVYSIVKSTAERIQLELDNGNVICLNKSVLDQCIFETRKIN